ncbi:MAG: hypothetical protein HY856_13510 [Burkholderiales bacterium]|nr:hypothetical protein [Burkholderiales bacterium]
MTEESTPIEPSADAQAQPEAVESPAPADGVVAESGPQPETVTYADGTEATGTPPLPEQSPAEQEAAGDLPAPDSPLTDVPTEPPADDKPRLATPKELHDIWCAKQIAHGWAFGATFDAVNRTDPRLVHYDLLTPEQQAAYSDA